MTKQEYIAKQRTMTRAVNRRLVCWLIVFFAAIGAMIPFSNYVEEHKEYAWTGNVVGGGLLFILVASFVWFALVANRQQREFGIQCRSCSKRILNSQLAIATGNCGYCGEKLFD
ncbi:MAG TPA: hypothetical protein VN048_11565 [Verrucomicrobiae bacterium]|jgi:hypothetical protein|nr:hypothetical protein [Verrucomicrobiae bacterium]